MKCWGASNTPRQMEDSPLASYLTNVLVFWRVPPGLARKKWNSLAHYKFCWLQRGRENYFILPICFIMQTICMTSSHMHAYTHKWIWNDLATYLHTRTHLQTVHPRIHMLHAYRVILYLKRAKPRDVLRYRAPAVYINASCQRLLFCHAECVYNPPADVFIDVVQPRLGET